MITQHIVKQGYLPDGILTYCGRVGYPTQWPGDYDTEQGHRLVALRTEYRCTCKACLRALVASATSTLKALEDHNKELERSK